MPIQAMHFI